MSLPDLSWMADAACKGRTDTMYLLDGQFAPGLEVCERCPVRTPCRTRALIDGEEYGIWGGLRPEDRSRVRGPVARLRQCVECARWFEALTPNGRYCSDACRQRGHNRHSSESHRRRAS